LSLLQNVKNDLGAHQTPCSFVYGAISPSEKRPRREADQLPPSSVVVKNAWSYTSTLPAPHVFTSCKETVTLTLYYCISATAVSASTQAELNFSAVYMRPLNRETR